MFFTNGISPRNTAPRSNGGYAKANHAKGGSHAAAKAASGAVARHDDRALRSAPQPQTVIVLTDDMVRDLFDAATIILDDGVVPVEGRRIGWKRTNRGPLGAIYANPLTGARFLFAPDLKRQGRMPVCIARLA